MNWRATITALLLVIAAVIGWALWRQRAGVALTGPGAYRPDYVLNDFELIALNGEGHEAFSLRAPKLTRNPASKAMDVATPTFTIPPKVGSGGQPWQVTARTAWIAAEGEELRLRGDVRATSRNASGSEIKLASEELNVFPETKRATSAVAVTVTQPGLILNGRELEALLDSKRVSLKDIKARYERTAR